MNSERSPAPYERLAAIYDSAWAEYSVWVAGLVQSLETESRRHFAAVCDAACGTGVLLSELNDGERALAGFDRSAAMLEYARERLPGATLALGNLEDDPLPVTGPFDLITCVYDSLNYLQSEVELIRFLRSARRQLADGGAMLLDVNTPALYRSRNGQVIPRLIAGLQVRERLEYEPGPPPIATTTFEFSDATEVHRQRAWTIVEMEEALRATGFDLVDTLDVVDADSDEASGKVVFITVGTDAGAADA